jgi:hypothetical protein
MKLQLSKVRNRRGVSLAESLVATALFGGMLYVMISLQIFMARENVQASIDLDAERRLNEIWKAFGSTRINEMFFPEYIGNSPNSIRPNGPVNSEVLPTSISARWLWESGYKYMDRLQPQLYALRLVNGVCVPWQRLEIDFNRERQTMTIEYIRTRYGIEGPCSGIRTEPGDSLRIGPTTWSKITDVQLVSSPTSSLLFLWFKSNGDWRCVTAGIRV